jgi:hypothetical protein
MWPRMGFFWVSAALSLAGGVAFTAAAQDDPLPPKAEREAVARLAERGAVIQVDGQYRVIGVALRKGCGNEDILPLVHLARLRQLTLAGEQFTDAALEPLKALTQLELLTLHSSGLSSVGVAALRAALPRCQVTAVDPPQNGAPVAERLIPLPARSKSPPPLPFGVSTYTTRSSTARTLVTSPAVQDDLELSPEQQKQVAAATDVAAIIAGMDAKVVAILSEPQRARLKQIELQQRGAAAFVQPEIAEQLNLTKDQVAGLRKLLEQYAVRERTAVSQATRGGPFGVGGQLRERNAALAKERDEKILELLTPEQRDAWAALRGPPGPKVSLSPVVSAIEKSEAVPPPNR